MKVLFSSLTGEHFGLELDLESTTYDASVAICKHLGIPFTPLQLFFNNKLVHSSTKFSDLSLNPDSLILYRVVPNEKHHEINKNSSHAYNFTKFLPITSDVDSLIQYSNNTKAEMSNPLYSHYQNSVDFERRQKQRDPRNMQQLINELVSMGYDEESSKKALRNNHYNIQEAAAFLVSPSDGPVDLISHFMRSRRNQPSQNSPYHKFFSRDNFMNTRSVYIYSQDEIKQVHDEIETENQAISQLRAELKKIEDTYNEIMGPDIDNDLRNELEQYSESEKNKITLQIQQKTNSINELTEKYQCMINQEKYKKGKSESRNSHSPRPFRFDDDIPRRRFFGQPNERYSPRGIFPSIFRRPRMPSDDDEDFIPHPPNVLSDDDMESFRELDFDEDFIPRRSNFSLRKRTQTAENGHRFSPFRSNPRPIDKPQNDNRRPAPQHREENNEQDEFHRALSSLDDETKSILQRFAAQAHVSFGEVVQMFVISERNINQTKNLLGL